MIRTKPEDGLRIGKFMCERLNNSYAPCAIYLPIRSLSSLDVQGGETCDDEARRLLYEAISLKTCVNRRVTTGAPGKEAMEQVLEIYRTYLEEY